jgi:hypothetical protein
MTWFSLIFAILFFASGGYFAWQHINQFKTNETLRNEAISLNNTYVKEQLPSTVSNSIVLNHKGNSIESVSKLTVKNNNEAPLNKLIFSLNDGLLVQNFKLNGQELPFERKDHLIISENITIQPGQEEEVEITYSGKINETLCYLDIPEEERTEKYGKFVLNVDKRYAFLTPHYVLLTPEANWYPRTGVTYSTEDVSWNHPEFINFSLEVKTKPGLQPVSQGEMTKVSEGEFTFNNTIPLTQISLAIGNYEKKNFQTDSLEYGIWHIKGHDYFTESFPETKDTLAQLVNERMGDFERTYNLDYAFNRFFLVEVPAQFKTFERIWSGRQEFIQPEQVLIPEKGYMLREADFEGSKKRMERWGRRGDNNMTEKDKEIRLLFEFMGIFTREQSADFQRNRGNFSVQEIPNPYFIFAMLYNFQNNIISDQWPITNRIFEAYLKSQSADMRSGWMRNMQGMSDDELANIALQDSTFEEILADPEQKKIIDNVIKLKGEVLFSMVQWKAGQEEFEDFLREVLREYRFQNIDFEQFDQIINEKFDIQLIPMMDGWFKAKLTFRMGGGGGPGRGFGRGGGSDDMINKLVYLEPHQTKDVNYMFDADPRMVMVNTMTSQNIPQVIMEGFRDVEEDPRAVPQDGETFSDIPVRKQLPGEFIVDNEDPQFEITVTEDISLLEKWLAKETEGAQKYTGLNYWRPPANWSATTNSDFFGEYVRSAHYIKAGDGSMKAKWHVPIEEAGYYDVYYHLYKPRRFGRRGNDDNGEYQFFIYSDEGTEEQSLGIQSAEEGWNHLGSYYFAPDTALVELTNKSQSRIVFADAVRLVKL